MKGIFIRYQKQKFGGDGSSEGSHHFEFISILTSLSIPTYPRSFENGGFTEITQSSILLLFQRKTVNVDKIIEALDKLSTELSRYYPRAIKFLLCASWSFKLGEILRESYLQNLIHKFLSATEENGNRQEAWTDIEYAISKLSRANLQVLISGIENMLRDRTTRNKENIRIYSDVEHIKSTCRYYLIIAAFKSIFTSRDYNVTLSNQPLLPHSGINALFSYLKSIIQSPSELSAYWSNSANASSLLECLTEIDSNCLALRQTGDSELEKELEVFSKVRDLILGINGRNFSIRRLRLERARKENSDGIFVAIRRAISRDLRSVNQWPTYKERLVGFLNTLNSLSDNPQILNQDIVDFIKMEFLPQFDALQTIPNLDDIETRISAYEECITFISGSTRYGKSSKQRASIEDDGSNAELQKMRKIAYIFGTVISNSEVESLIIGVSALLNIGNPILNLTALEIEYLKEVCSSNFAQNVIVKQALSTPNRTVPPFDALCRLINDKILEAQESQSNIDIAAVRYGIRNFIYTDLARLSKSHYLKIKSLSVGVEGFVHSLNRSQLLDLMALIRRNNNERLDRSVKHRFQTQLLKYIDDLVTNLRPPPLDTA